MRATIKAIQTTDVANGKGGYKKSVISYMQGGNERSYNAVSFDNPQVYAKIASLKGGDEVEVALVQDGKYWKWSAVDVVGNTPVGANAGTATAYAKAENNRYEDGTERAARQRLIVRQSSLTAAINLLTAGKMAPTPEGVLAQADSFCDWVFEVGMLSEDKHGFEGMADDIPQ